MPDHLTTAERAKLDRLNAKLAALDKQAEPIKRERKALLSLERQRRFLARKRGED